ncbi:MAG: hypothetical protein WDN49_21330 [Acetobacteraceae bacterium]
MLRQISRRLRNAVSCEIARRPDDDHPRSALLACNQLRAFKRTAAQRHIDPLCLPVDHLVRRGYLQNELRIGLEENGNDRQQQLPPTEILALTLIFLLRTSEFAMDRSTTSVSALAPNLGF